VKDDTPLKLTRDYARPPVDLATRKLLVALGRPLPGDEPLTARALAAGLALRRVALGLSQKEIAKRLSKSPRTLRSWELGSRIPEIPTLIAWATALGMQLCLKEWP